MNRSHALLLLLAAGLAGCDQATAQDAKKNAAAPAPAAAVPACCAAKADTGEESPMPEKVVKTDQEWKKQLTPEQYQVLREKGTERAFTGKYWNTKDAGMYRCAGCGAELFTSDTKFDSGCGWPSFTAPVDKAKVQEQVDTSHGMVRTEVLCARCGGHLGHVFNDGPGPTGLRYCINSVSIDLKKAEAEKSKPQE